jgi:hypothetical protein
LLAKPAGRAHSAGIRFNEHIEGDGPTVFAHACKLGLEGIVSKRKDSAYRSGRSPDWLKMKNPDAAAVKREVGLVKGARKMSVAPPGGPNRIMIYGPKSDGTYIIEFRMADGESLAIRWATLSSASFLVANLSALLHHLPLESAITSACSSWLGSTYFIG